MEPGRSAPPETSAAPAPMAPFGSPPQPQHLPTALGPQPVAPGPKQTRAGPDSTAASGVAPDTPLAGKNPSATIQFRGSPTPPANRAHSTPTATSPQPGAPLHSSHPPQIRTHPSAPTSHSSADYGPRQSERSPRETGSPDRILANSRILPPRSTSQQPAEPPKRASVADPGSLSIAKLARSPSCLIGDIGGNLLLICWIYPQDTWIARQ